MSTRKGIVGRVVMTAMAGLLLAALPGHAHAQISVVVSAGASNTADLDAVARMFSGQVTSWADGSKVQLVDQSETEVGKSFYDKVLQKGPAQVRKALTALLLSGQIPKPEQGSSDAEVKAALAKLPGSIGYIATSSLDDSVKELVRIQ
jgi:ABC-type phosphate transport system substrate-binding protein